MNIAAPTNDLQNCLYWLLVTNGRCTLLEDVPQYGLSDAELLRSIASRCVPAPGEIRPARFFCRCVVVDGRIALDYKDKGVLSPAFIADRVREWLRIPRPEDLLQTEMFGDAS